MDFSNCLGALDEKNIAIQCPENCGSNLELRDVSCGSIRALQETGEQLLQMREHEGRVLCNL